MFMGFRCSILLEVGKDEREREREREREWFLNSWMDGWMDGQRDGHLRVSNITMCSGCTRVSDRAVAWRTHGTVHPCSSSLLGEN